MFLAIEHVTEYHFNRPVFFEPHHLRLCPRTDGAQRLVRFAVQIEPTPAGVTQSIDVDGNLVTHAWFNDLHDRMMLRASSEVETLRDNPYDFLLTPANQRLPIGYQPWELVQLGPSLKRVVVPTHADPTRELGEQLRMASRGELVPFLARLCETICHRFKKIHRETGGPWLPATTMEQRQGACRDLAVLFIDVCRSVGLAARFVSGFHDGYSNQDKHYLHAWAEVYLPGAGWRGFDPTHGLAVADRHVAVAAAADPAQVAPVTATYRGNNVEAEMVADVQMEVIGAATVESPAVAEIAVA